MAGFSRREIPFRWEPDDLEPGQWISRVDIWIESYPTFYSVYRDGRHKPGMQVYWLVDDFVVCPNIWLNYYKSQVVAPVGVYPTGILVSSPEHVAIRGEALIASPDDSDAVSAIVSRIEPMIKRIEAKIDALP